MGRVTLSFIRDNIDKYTLGTFTHIFATYMRQLVSQTDDVIFYCDAIKNAPKQRHEGLAAFS